jgi:hypothetical protein
MLMTQTLSWLAFPLIWAAVAIAAEVHIDAYITNSPEAERASIFSPETHSFYAMFKAKGLSPGDKVRGVWIADDVGDAAPPNFKIQETALTAQDATLDAQFSLTKPGAWPRGDYHVEIYVNDKLAAKVKFSIKPLTTPKKQEQEQEEEESGD